MKKSDRMINRLGWEKVVDRADRAMYIKDKEVTKGIFHEIVVDITMDKREAPGIEAGMVRFMERWVEFGVLCYDNERFNGDNMDECYEKLKRAEWAAILVKMREMERASGWKTSRR